MSWKTRHPGGWVEIKLTETPDTDPCTQAPVSWAERQPVNLDCVNVAAARIDARWWAMSVGAL